MEIFKELPVKFFETPAKMSAWLDKHYAEPAGVWLKIAKKNASAKSISYAEALEVSLCYGWIDGQTQKYDDKYYLQRFTPRRPRSIWSKVNTAKAEALITSGKMKPSGLVAIEQAKADGRWDAAYHSSGSYKMPNDFSAELAKNTEAQIFFDSLNNTNQYAIYFRIQTALKPANRKAQIQKLISMLQEGKTFH